VPSQIYQNLIIRCRHDHQRVMGGAAWERSSFASETNQVALHFRHQKYRLSRTTLRSSTDAERHSRQGFVTRVFSAMGEVANSGMSTTSHPRKHGGTDAPENLQARLHLPPE
jgi:hypothetical protein